MTTTVYATGLLYLSVCSDETPERMLAEVNLTNPTGLAHGWELAPNKTFASGTPNPCECNQKPATHTHYLLVC